ncbi:Uncharacterized protein HZ326_8906 [Fusarium oxysporum f. sp. albedinis]|nr:Uncharacterized protein HZ326_8906 [Fusarium oxysporum f. sp. albedinis]
MTYRRGTGAPVWRARYRTPEDFVFSRSRRWQADTYSCTWLDAILRQNLALVRQYVDTIEDRALSHPTCTTGLSKDGSQRDPGDAQCLTVSNAKSPWVL